MDEVIVDENTWLSSLSNVLAILQASAWFIVAAFALIYYIWKEFLSPKYYKWMEKKKMRERAAFTKKDPESYLKQDEARISAVKRLQDEYDKQASIMQQTIKDKEEKKKMELYSKLKHQGGRKLNDTYYPLSGKSTMSYTPKTRRTGCPGGC